MEIPKMKIAAGRLASSKQASRQALRPRGLRSKRPTMRAFLFSRTSRGQKPKPAPEKPLEILIFPLFVGESLIHSCRATCLQAGNQR
jgi:hypothetical protein